MITSKFCKVNRLLFFTFSLKNHLEIWFFFKSLEKSLSIHVILGYLSEGLQTFHKHSHHGLSEGSLVISVLELGVRVLQKNLESSSSPVGFVKVHIGREKTTTI